MTRVVLYVVLLTGATLAGGQLCGESRDSVERGMIRLPDVNELLDFDEDILCFWNYTAPEGLRLMAKIDFIHLPAPNLYNTSLRIILDGQFFPLLHNCVKCSPERLGGANIQVFFYAQNLSLANASQSGNLDMFQIRLKSFDPDVCETPSQPENGYVIGKEWRVGKEVLFYCNPPYDLIGSSTSKCGSVRNALSPQWTSAPPKCILRNCSNGPIYRHAGVGAIASPGYPISLKAPAASCRWEIAANPGQQIRASLSYLHFPNSEIFEKITTLKLALYDGNVSNPIVNLTSTVTTEALNFTTWTNRLIVHFFAESIRRNERQDQMGFYLEYSAVPGFCPDISPPLNGELIAYSLSLGSTIVYRCSPGYRLVGSHHAECLSTGNWSQPKPTCELAPLLEVSLDASNYSETVVMTFDTSLPTQAKTSKSKFKTLPASKVISKDKPNSIKNAKDSSLKTKETLLLRSDNETKWVEKLKYSKENVLHTNIQNVWQPEEKGPEGPYPTSQLHEEPAGNRINLLLVAAVAGLLAPLGVALLLFGILVAYRRRYPVRMRFGRKFSTFENPVYAQHPQELSRLAD